MTPAARRVRLDSLLSDRGVFSSRSRAAASVMAGDVLLLPDRRRAEKPGQLVDPEVELEVRARPTYASRGGVKLANALDRLDVSVVGRHALDVGASTGGFTDCLLRREAEHVVAVDVAYGQLDYRLREDERVTVIERCNARNLTARQLPYRPDLVVIDVSFISLTKVLPAAVACAAPRHDVVALIKPQFEVGRNAVGKGGVVRDLDARRRALVDVGEFARRSGSAVLGYAASGLPGPKGNRESFMWLGEPSRQGGLEDLAAAVAEIDA
jgi:23S rRNA (cytidine1920-2'-O)/16S rRNA (cytidine1409-2'-O)-methyltransferase